MALVKDNLKTALLTVFQSAKDEAWDEAKVADEMAKAIHNYVRAAAVRKVVVNLENGQQAGDGALE
jgi:hypothetical protein